MKDAPAYPTFQLRTPLGLSVPISHQDAQSSGGLLRLELAPGDWVDFQRVPGGVRLSTSNSHGVFSFWPMKGAKLGRVWTYLTDPQALRPGHFWTGFKAASLGKVANVCPVCRAQGERRWNCPECDGGHTYDDAPRPLPPEDAAQTAERLMHLSLNELRSALPLVDEEVLHLLTRCFPGLARRGDVQRALLHEVDRRLSAAGTPAGKGA